MKTNKLGVESVKIGKPTALWLNGEWNRKISLQVRRLSNAIKITAPPERSFCNVLAQQQEKNERR